MAYLQVFLGAQDEGWLQPQFISGARSLTQPAVDHRLKSLNKDHLCRKLHAQR